MIGWLLDRRMVGGVVFGPAAWKPVRVENTFGAAGAFVEEQGAGDRVRELPGERREAAAFLEEVGVARTSAVVPSLADQLRGLGESRVRALVLNLVPTQPEFAMGSAMTRLGMADVLAGLETVQKLVRAERVLIVGDREDRETLGAWRQAVRGKGYEVRGVLNRYPQGHPVILVRTLFGKRLPVDALPSRGGRVIVETVTCWGVGRWIRTGAGLSERPVQLFVEEGAGRQAGGAARLVMGRVGEPIEAFCRRYGVVTEGKQVIVNGMLAGREVATGCGEEVPAMLESSTESVAVRGGAYREPPSACLACGWCVDVCPTALVPVRLMELAKRLPSGEELMRRGGLQSEGVARQLKGREARESLHCIGCGLCSYVCPTRLPLMEETLKLRLRVAGAMGRPDKSGGMP